MRNTHGFSAVDAGRVLQLSHFLPGDVIEDPYLTPGREFLYIQAFITS